MKDSLPLSLANNWIVLPETLRGQEERVARDVQARVAGQIETGRYREADVDYIRALRLSLPSSARALSSDDLERMRRLCQLWEVSLRPPTDIRSHRPIVGPLIVAAKKALFPIVNFFLKEVLRKQRDFNAAVVHYLLMNRVGDPSECDAITAPDTRKDG